MNEAEKRGGGNLDTWDSKILNAALWMRQYCIVFFNLK